MLGPEIEFSDRDKIIFRGKKYLYLAGTDYHRMSTRPLITEAVQKAVREYGLSPTGSRTTTGNHKLLTQLERKVAGFFGSESALVFSTGYLSNLIMMQAIAGDFDLLFLDEQAHSSLELAASSSGKKVIRYRFMDPQHLKEQIEAHITAGSRILVMTDGVFPARGEMPPLKEYEQIVARYEGKILVDDAHAMAVMGKTGKGSWEEKGLDREMVYQTGTLSKGFGTLGGVIQGSAALISRIQEKSSAYVGSTGLALPLAAAGIRSIEYLMSHRLLIQDLQKRSLALKRRFRETGIEMPETPAPIFPVTLYDEEKNRRLRDILLNNGIYPPFINYPGAPPGGHFRFIITSETTEEQTDLLFETIRSAL